MAWICWPYISLYAVGCTLSYQQLSQTIRKRNTLTVVHLQDAVRTRDVREIVARFDAVCRVLIPVIVVDVFVDILAILVRSARGRHVVPTGVVRVYRAVVAVVIGAGQRVPVETFLRSHVVRAEVAGVADGELDVSLGSRFERGGSGRGRVRFDFLSPREARVRMSYDSAERYLVDVLWHVLHSAVDNTLEKGRR